MNSYYQGKTGFMSPFTLHCITHFKNRQASSDDVVHRLSWHEITTPPSFFNYRICLHIYFKYNFFISLSFHLFSLILTMYFVSFSSNLMLTTTYMCRTLLASVTFNAPYFHYVIQTRTCINS